MGLLENQSDAPPVGSQGDQETSFLGTNLSVKGKVSGSGNLNIMDKFEGELDLAGDLVIAPSAVVSGEIKAVTIAVNGNFSATLTGRDQIDLQKSFGSGRITTPRLSVSDGALFNDEIEMKKPAGGAVNTPAGGKESICGRKSYGQEFSRRIHNIGHPQSAHRR